MTTSRRDFLKTASAATLFAAGCQSGTHTSEPRSKAGGVWVNDAHSQLNHTRVAGISEPASLDELRTFVTRAANDRTPFSVCGGRHAAGGQQFLTGKTLVDTGRLDRMLSFNPARGTAEFEAGAKWDSVLAALRAAQPGNDFGLTIHQRQGGARELSLGGAVASNIHSRCLTSVPFIGDVESLQVLEPGGSLVRCSRGENADRFTRIVGGYGLFGLVYSVELRLVRRQKLKGRIDRTVAEEAINTLERRISEGAVHGAFEFSLDPASPGFMRDGFCVTFAPVPDETPVRPTPPDDHGKSFLGLAGLIHSDPAKAMRAYKQAVAVYDGQVDFADIWVASDYINDYHTKLGLTGTEVLAEIDVPRAELAAFLSDCRTYLRGRDAKLIYSIVRLIRADSETALPWAKQDYACVIFNLHTEHDAAALARTRETFQGLYDRALTRGGSFYLTYNRFARKEQLLAAYPGFPDFVAAKIKYDPESLMESDWYRHYRELLRI